MTIARQLQAEPTRPPRPWAVARAACACLWLAILLVAAAYAPAMAQATATAEDPSATAPRVLIRFLTASDFPPFNALDEDGVLTGLNVDLARAICLDLSVTCDIQTRPWEELLPALGRGEADAVIAAHTVNVRSLESVDFTEPYFRTPGRFVGRRDRTDLSITPDGLDRRTVGVADTTAHAAFLDLYFRFSRIQKYPTVEKAREALLAGEVDLVFDDGIGLAFWLNGTLSGGCCMFHGGPFFEPKFFGDGIAIAVRKGDRALRGQLNAALKAVRASGRMAELVQRYFPLQVY